MRILFIISLLFVVSFAFAEETYWIKAIGGKDVEYAPSIKVIDTGYIAIGHTKSFGAGDFDFLAVKLNRAGEPISSRTFGGPGEDKAFCIEPTMDGGFIVVGNTKSFGAGNLDFLVIKTDKDLNIEWAKTIGNEGMDLGFYAQEIDGGYVVIGNTTPVGEKGKKALIVKLDKNGNFICGKSIGGGRFIYGIDGIRKTRDGGYILNGTTNYLGYKEGDALVIKLDKDFNIQWARAMGGEGKDTTNWDGVRETSDGGYIFAGETGSFGKGDYSGWVVKLRPNGDIEWARVLDGGEDEALWAVNETSDGGFIISGVGGRPTKKRPERGMGQPMRKGRPGAGVGPFNREPLPADIILAKLDRNGNLLWARLIGGSKGGLEEVEEVKEVEDGYILAGITEALGSGKGDFFIAKVNKDGLISGCNLIRDFPATVTSPTPECKAISFEVVSVSPKVSSVSPIVTTPSIQVKDATYESATGERAPLERGRPAEKTQKDERWWLNKKPGSISGKVIDNNGNPLEGVTVTVFGTELKSITDKGGNYRIENASPAAPRYIIVAEKDGYFDSQMGDINVQEAQDTVVNLRMQVYKEEYSYWNEELEVMICYLREVKESEIKQPSQDAVLDPKLYPDNVRPYLLSSRYIDSGSPIVKDVANKIIESIPESSRKKQTIVAKAVYDWVVKNIHYDLMRNFPEDVTCGNWQTTYGGWGHSFGDWLYLPSEIITQQRAICIEYERLATALLRAVGIPARPAPLRAHPVTQWWVQLPDGGGYWANMETSVGHTLWEQDGNLWARFPSKPDSQISFYPVNEDAPIQVDWWTDNPCIWEELYGQTAQFDFSEQGKREAEDGFSAFEKQGKVPRGEKPMHEPRRPDVEEKGHMYQVSSRGCTIDLTNIGEQKSLIARFPIFFDTEYTKVLKITHWTNHPECIVRTWTEEEKGKESGEVLKWYMIEFKIGSQMRHVEKKTETIRPERAQRFFERTRPGGFGEEPGRGENIQQLAKRLRMLIQEKKRQGVDTSNAERLDKQSRQEFMSGNKEECKRLLMEAIEELEKK